MRQYQGSLSSYLTTATASSTYATQTSLSSYATTSSLSSYLTTATASSTYATITSLADYVKTSIANTFTAKQTFNAGIGLPISGSTITAPTANMIGHIISNSSLVNGATITTTQSAYTIGQITLTGPINSVWMVFSQFGLTCQGSSTLNACHWGINLGSSYTFGTTAYGMTSIPPIGNNVQHYGTSYTVVVQPALNQVITLGGFINPGGTGGVVIKCWGITATRIA